MSEMLVLKVSVSASMNTVMLIVFVSQDKIFRRLVPRNLGLLVKPDVS